MKFSNPLKVEFNNHRIFGLDIMRFFAIFAVVWGHASGIFPKRYSNIHERLFPVDGVTIFFVLSGFLIGGILLKILEKKPPSFKVLFNFWVRRWLRTLPAYYFILILLCIIHLRYDTGFKISDAKYFFVFMQNFTKYTADLFGESWSLSIEEWFYLTVPALIFISLGLKLFTRKNTIFFTAIFILVSVTVLRYCKYMYMPPHNLQQWDVEYRRLVITRLDSLMFGVIGAYLSMYYNSLWLKMKVLMPIGIIIMLILGCSNINFTTIFTSVFFFSLYSLATLMCLPKLSQVKSGSGVFYRVITQISIISYSMYLLNYSIIREFIIKQVLMKKLIPHLPLSGITINLFNYLAYWILLFLLSALMYNYIETPVMRLRDRISKS